MILDKSRYWSENCLHVHVPTVLKAVRNIARKKRKSKCDFSNIARNFAQCLVMRTHTTEKFYSLDFFAPRTEWVNSPFFEFSAVELLNVTSNRISLFLAMRMPFPLTLFDFEGHGLHFTRTDHTNGLFVS